MEEGCGAQKANMPSVKVPKHEPSLRGPLLGWKGEKEERGNWGRFWGVGRGEGRCQGQMEKKTSAWWCLFRRLSFFVWQLVFAIDSREHYFIHRELVKQRTTFKLPITVPIGYLATCVGEVLSSSESRRHRFID